MKITKTVGQCICCKIDTRYIYFDTESFKTMVIRSMLIGNLRRLNEC